MRKRMILYGGLLLLTACGNQPAAATDAPVGPAETTEVMQPPTESTKPSDGSGSGNISPEWTPPML